MLHTTSHPNTRYATYINCPSTQALIRKGRCERSKAALEVLGAVRRFFSGLVH